MKSPQLPNYLRSYRKRLALSQDDMAFLLGTKSGAKVCRYERFSRKPNLNAVFAFEAIFQKPASELFRGIYQEIETHVAARAKVLLNRVEKEQLNRRNQQKRKVLCDIAFRASGMPGKVL